MDLSSPRWRERPEALRQFAAERDPLCPVAHSPAATDAGDNELRSTLDTAGAGCLHRQLSTLLHRAAALVPYREIGKHEFLRGYELLREVLQALSARSGLGDGIHFLTVDEIQRLTSDTHVEHVVLERRAARRAALALDVPCVLDVEGDMSEFGTHRPSHARRTTTCSVSLSCGQGTGIVCRLVSNRSIPQSTAGAVIVAPTIDPGMTPFLVNAAAIVVEHGGQLSHVALLARQLGIPAVVVPGISGDVDNGDSMCVDADRGLVEIVERRP
jgi:pyruvate,water dikinase